MHQTISLIAQKPLLWHWPGYVWPGKHYEKDYLTNQKNPFSLIENIYLQTTINQGIIWLILRCTIRISLLLYHRRLSWKTNINNNIIYITQNLGIWLLWLLSIGMFLHVFIDSIVNYLFFMLYGITLSYSIHQSHKKQEI